MNRRILLLVEKKRAEVEENPGASRDLAFLTG